MNTTSSNKPPGLRERRRSELMEALSQVALRLMAEHGFDAVSLQQIAIQAGVSLRTLFRHFPTKEALFGFEVQRRERQILERFSSRPDDERLIDAYLFAIDTMMNDYMSHPGVADREFGVLQEVPALRAQYLVSSQQRKVDEMDAEFARRLCCQASDGRLRLLRYSLVNAVMVATSEWQQEGGSGDLRAKVPIYVALFEPIITAIQSAKMA